MHPKINIPTNGGIISQRHSNQGFDFFPFGQVIPWASWVRNPPNAENKTMNIRAINYYPVVPFWSDVTDPDAILVLDMC